MGSPEVESLPVLGYTNWIGVSSSTSSTLSPDSSKGEYPFPRLPLPLPGLGVASVKMGSQRRSKGHSRISSIASNTSFMSTISARILPSKKSTASLASMAEDYAEHVYRHKSDVPSIPTNQGLALDSLRRIRASSARPADVVASCSNSVTGTGYQSWWPLLSSWSLGGQSNDGTRDKSERAPILRHTHSTLLPPRTGSTMRPKHETPTPGSGSGKPTPAADPSPARKQSRPDLRTTTSSPNIPHLQQSHSSNSSTSLAPSLSQRHRSRLETSETDSINTIIDPELAAAESRSALTKKVSCGVCGIKGVNFPNCRKCEMTFCSRECRVDEKRGGDGKRHVCGAWESRQFLIVPTTPARSRRKSIARPSPLAVKA